MRNLKFLWLVALLALLLSSCDKPGEEKGYEADHEHSYGVAYTVRSVTCLEAGSQVRYCGICHKEESVVVAVADDVDQRAHDFSYTVVPPTESAWGYTVKLCRACGYTVDRCDEIPPLYLLATNDETVTVVPHGLSAAMWVESGTKLLPLAAAVDTAVDADIARRLGVALAVTELVEAGELSADAPVQVLNGGLAGRTYTLRQLIAAFVKTGSEDAAHALADACGESMADFTLRVRQRMARLGLQNSTEIYPVVGVNPQKTTLYDTAVLLVRALDTPVIAAALAEVVPDLSQIAGQTPSVYLTDAAGGLRVTALAQVDGTYRCLLLCGASLPDGAEEGILGAR